MLMMLGLALLLVCLFQGSYGQTGAPMTTAAENVTYAWQGFLNCSDTVYGDINSSEIDIWGFFLDEEYATVELNTCGSDYDTYIYILNASGNEIYECDDCGSCGTRTIATLSDFGPGFYYVLISGCCGNPHNGGNYTLNVSCTEKTQTTSTPQPYTTSKRYMTTPYQTRSPYTTKQENVTYTWQGFLNCSDSVYGDINSNEIDVWGFLLNEEYPTVELNTCGSGYDTYIYVLNATGNEIYECDDCGNCGTRTIATLSDFGPGFYYVFISGCCGNPHDGGNYTLNVSCTDEIQTTITPGTTSERYMTTPYQTRPYTTQQQNVTYTWQGFLNCSDTVYGDITSLEIDVWGFYLDEEYPTVELNTCGSDYDTYIYIINASGSEIYECDDCGNCGTRTIATLSDFGPGFYFVFISGCCGNPHSDGNYTLNVLCTNETQTTTTPRPYTTQADTTSERYTTTPYQTRGVNYTYQGSLACGDYVSGDIGSYEIDLYYFPVCANYTNITLNTCGSGYDTYIYVYDSSFDVIYSCDDCGNCGLRTILSLGNVEQGSYYVGISGCCGNPHDGGTYNLSVICEGGSSTIDPCPTTQPPETTAETKPTSATTSGTASGTASETTESPTSNTGDSGNSGSADNGNLVGVSMLNKIISVLLFVSIFVF